MIELLRHLESVELHAVRNTTNRHLKEQFPERFVTLTENSDFVVGPWAAAAKLEVEHPTPGAFVRLTHGDGEDETVSWILSAGHERFAWNGATYETLTLSLPQKFGDLRCCWIIAPTREASDRLYAEVVEWNGTVRDEVLVFSAGCFSKDPKLLRAIQTVRLDELVLPEALSRALQTDVSQFFASKALYAQAGAAWKRGMLLLGPPGNGKTHAIKALVKHAGLPCIYVKSLNGRHAEPSETIPALFRRARKLAPCVIVLEDLDALIDDDNRSFLLNELDGFAENSGLLTIATSNHPDRLDPSLIHRPSRFDRKYRFELPDLSLRHRYLERWAATVPDGVSPAALVRAAEDTEGFTFAYLKEAGLSTLMQWVSEGRARNAGDVLQEVVAGLKQEILALPAGPPPPPKKEPRFPYAY